MDKQIPNGVVWRGAIDRQVVEKVKSQRYIESLLLLCAERKNLFLWQIVMGSTNVGLVETY